MHRDVTPGNVLLTRRRGGAVKLADFGMVKFPDWSESREGAWLGTLDYIAPEQRENAAGVDARADVYAAGRDFLDGQKGDDILTGGAGADVFYLTYESVVGDHGHDTITDFSHAEYDKLNIADLLHGYDPGVDTLSDFLQIAAVDGNTTVSVNEDGRAVPLDESGVWDPGAGGDAYGYVQVATLLDVVNLGLNDLLYLQYN